MTKQVDNSRHSHVKKFKPVRFWTIQITGTYLYGLKQTQNIPKSPPSIKFPRKQKNKSRAIALPKNESDPLLLLKE